MNQKWPIQLLVALIVIGGPIIRKIIQALAQQRELAVAAARRQQHQEELLRTGQSSIGDMPMPPAGAEVDPSAARRRAQLEEVRRRGQKRAATTPSIDLTASMPGRRGPTVAAPTLPRAPQRPAPRPQPKIQARPVPAARTTARQSPPSRPAPATGRLPARPTQRPSPPVPAQQSRRQSEKSPSRSPRAPLATPPAPRILAPEVAPVAVGLRGSALDLHTAPLADWRRAFIMREVLDAPLALREPAGQ